LSLATDKIQNRLQNLIGRRGQRLDDLSHRLQSAATRRLRTPSTRLAALTQRLDRHNPSVRLALARRRLEFAGQSFNRLASATIAARTARLDHAAARLQALSPLAVLNRGYALVYSANNQLLRSAIDTHPGGSLTAKVETVDSE
jgi:exodeoxyribonuclease VII large subunit